MSPVPGPHPPPRYDPPSPGRAGALCFFSIFLSSAASTFISVSISISFPRITVRGSRLLYFFFFAADASRVCCASATLIARIISHTHNSFYTSHSDNTHPSLLTQHASHNSSRTRNSSHTIHLSYYPSHTTHPTRSSQHTSSRIVAAVAAAGRGS